MIHKPTLIVKILSLSLTLTMLNNLCFAFEKSIGSITPTIAQQNQQNAMPPNKTIKLIKKNTNFAGLIKKHSISIKDLPEYTKPEKAKTTHKKDEQFLKDVTDFVEKKTEEITKNSAQSQTIFLKKPQKKTLLFIIPNPKYISHHFTKLILWFNKKDPSYGTKSSSDKNRAEWETLLGVDVFHPYYKYKEAEKAIRKKYQIKGPKNFKIRPEYSGSKLKITISKKF